MAMSFDLIFGSILLLSAALYIIMILGLTAGILKNSGKSKGEDRLAGYFATGQAGAKTTVMARVSVIVPVRNEVGCIAGCLDDLALQYYPGDLLEIIVSDDFSEDYTLEKVRKWGREHPEISLTLLEGGSKLKENRGKKSAIERAVAIARGEIIIATDADTLHGRSWVRTITGAFGNPEVKMVLGPVGFTGEKGIFAKIQTLEFLGIMGVSAGSANLGFSLMCNGANLAYRKQAYTECGGFEGNTLFQSGDDQFLMMKFRKNFGGRSVVFLNQKDAIVLTAPCSAWHDFWEQRLRWVSKSRGYRDTAVITAGLLTFGFPFLILIGGIAGIFHPAILFLASFLWFLKILAEYPMVWLMARFFDKKHLLNYYFAAQVFQFFYSLTVAIAGQFTMYSWKGRSIKPLQSPDLRRK